jgi:hypothetical protein
MRTGLMSSRNSPTLTLDVRRRRAERHAASLALVAGACGVLLLDVTWTNLLAGAGCLAAIGFGLWRAGWIGSRHRIVGLRWVADGRWLLTDSRENALAGELSAGTRLARNALWLRWTTPHGRQRSMLLAPGDLPPSQLRALRVRLRIEALERALPDVPRR